MRFEIFDVSCTCVLGKGDSWGQKFIGHTHTTALFMFHATMDLVIKTTNKYLFSRGKKSYSCKNVSVFHWLSCPSGCPKVYGSCREKGNIIMARVCVVASIDIHGCTVWWVPLLQSFCWVYIMWFSAVDFRVVSCSLWSWTDWSNTVER